MRNKIRKKILSLLLAGILSAGLCGCGQEAETQKTRVAMIVKSTESAFWKSVFAGAGAAAAAAAGGLTAGTGIRAIRKAAYAERRERHGGHG